MPRMSYCAKCQQEVPFGELCPICGKKLVSKNQHLSFQMLVSPHKDWFCWCRYLKIALPVWLLVTLLPMVLECYQTGAAGLLRLLKGNYLFLVLGLLSFFILCILVLLLLQGKEIVCVIIDANGVQETGFLYNPSQINLRSRFLSDHTLRHLKTREVMELSEGMVLIRKNIVPWHKVRRVKCVDRLSGLLLYHPYYRLVLPVRCPDEEYVDAETYVRTLLKKNPEIKIEPVDEIPAKGKSR